MFSVYFEQGFKHITDLAGYDHIAFLLALLIGYTYRESKQILILVTAFTVGHSITLALSTLDIISFPSEWIEFLIPVTIFLTAIIHLIKDNKNGFKGIYALTLFFGFIHGAGFSNYLKMLLSKSRSVFTPLLAFNIGVEVGQLVIVAIILIVTYVVIDLLKIKRAIWKWTLGILSLIVSISLMVETWPL